MNGSSTTWLPDALMSPVTLWCAIAAAGCIAGIAVLLVMLRRLHPSRNASADAGTATLEFALIIPFLLFLILILAQTTFLMSGNLFVHYAAFAATRSAIVQIPRPPENIIIPVNGNAKYDAIRAAAVFAVAPVAGQRAQGDTDVDTLVDTLSSHYENNGQPVPRWLTVLVAGRLRYADYNTAVRILRTEVEDNTVYFDDIAETGALFGPREVVTVRISHNFNLGVPVIWPIFADDDATGDARFTTIEAQYSMINEGVSDQLPPQPTGNRQRMN